MGIRARDATGAGLGKPLAFGFPFVHPSVAKTGGLQRQGTKGEAVVIDCNPLATLDLGASGFPVRVKK